MKMVEVRLISFSRHSNEPTYLYGLSTREPKEGDYVYNRNWGKFMCVQFVGKGMFGGHNENWHTIEISNNPDLNMPQIPQAIVKAYFDSGKQLKTATVRI